MSLRTRLGFTEEPLYLMDGSAFIFRSFYAYRNMTRSDGFPTNALYMVARLILRLLREEKPAYFCFVMDGKGPTFRHERFPAYKAQRSATPEDLVRQLAPLQDLLRLLGVPVVVSQGCEADDCIASLAGKFREERPVVILGADKDLKQCLHEQVVLWDPAAKDEKITTLASFREETGMEPSSWPDYQALVGDSSDNIPGVPKIGPKTAIGLIQEFKTLEELFDRLPAVPPKVRPKLDGQREIAFLCRELTRLQCDACPHIERSGVSVLPMQQEEAAAFLSEYELRSLEREVASMLRAGFLAGAASAKSSPPKKAAGPKKEAGSVQPAQSQQTAAPVAGSLLAGNVSGPQAIVPPASSAAEQGSLFAAAAPEPEFIRVETPAALPAAAGPVVLMPVDKGLLVASAGWERLYTGEPDALAAFLIPLQAEDGLPAVLITPDLKALYRLCPAFAGAPTERFFDLSLAAYLLSPEERAYSWAQVAERWGDQAGSTHSREGNPGLLALDLYVFMREQLTGGGLSEVLTALEQPLVPVLYAMEERGIVVNKAAFADFLSETQSELERLTATVHEMAGRTFNIRSSQQLGDVLFSVLDLPKSGKTKGGAASTSQESLEKLVGKHPIVEAVLEFRKLEKLRSTYLEPLPRLADDENRIHTTFNQTATATGRLSSSNPNLQNIPVRGPQGTRMRACFTAAPGQCIVSADYSQIELRVLAHLSGDPALLGAFRNNEDIHSRTAGLLFDVPLEDVTAEQRRNAKTINFGLIYGMGAQKLAQELRISMKEAKEFIERYFSRLSKLKEFYEAIEEDAKQHGFVSTMAGRRRFTPDILSGNNQVRSQARRQAINTRIQGSAADIIKIVMPAVENDAELRSLNARLLLQIHDELLMEAPVEHAEAAGKRLAALMSGVQPGGEPLSVPLVVDWGVGPTWAEAH